jgi:anti-sigma28 factor (negative regulator of flagellin synthesis)
MNSSEIKGPNLRMFTTSGSGGPSPGSRSEEPTVAKKIQLLLDQIRAMDKTMDEARAVKIARIKRAIAEGTYHVSAAEVARTINSFMQEVDAPPYGIKEVEGKVKGERIRG